MLASLFNKAVQTSKVFGVVSVLIGFPAALLGAYRFSGEVYDTLTTPDVAVGFPRLTLRCFYRFTNQAAFEEYARGNSGLLVENCDRSRLAVSFEAVLKNNDRIGRTVTAISLDLKLPPTAPQVSAGFDQVWHVSHRIEGVIETNTRTPWAVTSLPAGATIRQELWMIQTAPSNAAIFWSDVLPWLTSAKAPPDNQIITARLTARISGHTAAFDCHMTLRPASLARFRDFVPIQQIRFTGDCQQAS